MDLAIMVLLTSFAATIGGRGQGLLTALQDTLSGSAMLIVAAIFTTAVATCAAAYLGAWLAAQFIGFTRAVLIGGAFTIAAVELVWPVRPVTIREPTRSLGAIILALMVRQLGEAPRWIAFAAAAMTIDPLKAGLGVSIGSSLALLAGWIAPSMMASRNRVRWLRSAIACLALAASIYVLWVGATIGA